MYAMKTFTLSIAALLAVVNSQDLLSVTVYTDDVCSLEPFVLTTSVATDFCFGNIGSREPWGDIGLGINCDAGTARITTYTDNARSSSPSEFGPDFQDCNPVTFNSIRLVCNQINSVNGRPTAGVNGTINN